MSNKEPGSLAGRTALVTGGSRDVGAASSKLLAARGANVIVNYFNNKDASDKVVEQINNKESLGAEDHAIATQADVRKQSQVEYMVGEAIQRYGRIDILVNNAMDGRYFLKLFLETTWDDFAEKFNDEIKAAYEVTRPVLPYMVKQNYGRFIYVATSSAKFPNFLVQLLLEQPKQAW